MQRLICLLSILAWCALALLPNRSPAQEAQAVFDPMARGAVQGLDVSIDYDLNKSPVKKIFVLFSSHWDREYTDPDDVERDQLIRHIDDLIDTAKANPDFRWMEEATWHIEGWMRGNPSPARQEEFFSLVRNGQISVGGTQQMICGLPDEINNRITYEPADFVDRYSLKPFEVAVAADYTGFSWNLIQPLARSGIKYLLNTHHIVFMPHDNIKMKDYPFWWEGPDGSRLLVWRIEYTSAIYPYGIASQGMKFFDGTAIGEAAKALDLMALTEVALKNQLKKITDEGYDKDAILVSYSHDNVLASRALDVFDHMKKWNATHASPQLILANPEDFFHYMEEKYGDKLPTYRGEYRRWFDGPGYDFVPGRRAALDMIDAEKYYTIDSLYGGKGYPTWMLGQELFDLIESAAHGGGAWEASELNEQYTAFRRNQLHDNIVSRAYYMRKTGFAALAQRVMVEKPSLVVFNNLSWNRSGVAEMPVMDWTFPTTASLIDSATGQPIPCEWAPYEPRSAAGMELNQMSKRLYNGEIGSAKVRFYAPNVPSLGYKAFTIVQSANSVVEPSFRTITSTETLKNAHFQITINPLGHILALRDIGAKRDITPPNPSEPFANLRVWENKLKGVRSFMDVKPVDLGQKPCTITVRQGNVSMVIGIQRPEDILERTEITLYEQVPQVRIKHYLNQEKLAQLDLSYWHHMEMRLPVNYPSEKLQVFIQSGDTVRGRGTSEFSGSDGDYTHGSMSYGCHFSDGSHGLNISSREITEVLPHALAYKPQFPVMLLECDPDKAYGIGQENAVEVVFSTDSGTADPAALYRAAYDGVAPLRANETRFGKPNPIWDKGKTFIQDNAFSAVSIDAPNVVVSALKQARTEGAGRTGQYTLRLQEIAGKNQTETIIQLPPQVKRAWLADQTERKKEEVPVNAGKAQVRLGKNETLTLRLEI